MFYALKFFYVTCSEFMSQRPHIYFFLFVSEIITCFMKKGIFLFDFEKTDFFNNINNNNNYNKNKNNIFYNNFIENFEIIFADEILKFENFLLKIKNFFFENGTVHIFFSFSLHISKISRGILHFMPNESALFHLLNMCVYIYIPI